MELKEKPLDFDEWDAGQPWSGVSNLTGSDSNILSLTFFLYFFLHLADDGSNISVP